MADFDFSDSVLVSRTPDEVYALVSDVTLMGGWSPVCKACWWEGADARSMESGADARSMESADAGSVGAWFIGRNETAERTWETRSQVVAADPGREFAWEVNGGWVRWGFVLEPAGETGQSTLLTQVWNFLPRGIAGFHDRFGETAEAEIAIRIDEATSGIPQTLAAIKASAEA